MLLKKEYAKIIEVIQPHYSSSKRIQVTSHCIVVVALSDGETTIPVSFKLWMFRGAYKRTKLLQQLILELDKHIEVDMLLADGLYAKVDMLKWLIRSETRTA